MTSHASSTPVPRKVDSWRMFDRIAPTYDLLNRLLSLGIDRGWRVKVAQALPVEPPQLDILDLATGTGDQVFAIIQALPGRIRSITGTDPSMGMLALAEKKTPVHIPGVPQPQWKYTPPGVLPFPDAAFDAITISFGIRNVPNPTETLREMHRVLRVGGRAVILEFSLPSHPLIRTLYLFYFRHVLPRIGGLLSGDRSAYEYLNRTVEEFPYGPAFEELLHNSGFVNTSRIPLTFGIATIYKGEKFA